jgi:hypothetical protein
MGNHEPGSRADQPLPQVPDTPHLEAQALAVFDRHVRDAACYLEYGAGGSTVRAARHGARHIIAVESSRNWADAVRGQVGGAAHVEVLYCDIGEVGAWGRPVDTQGIHAYHAYMRSPWQAARRQGLVPSVVMVDGRFRVACFLYSLLCAQAGTIILFDDYVNRPHYHVVEEFSRPCAFHGRLAVFEAGQGFDMADIAGRIAEYSIVAD